MAVLKDPGKDISWCYAGESNTKNFLWVPLQDGHLPPQGSHSPTKLDEKCSMTESSEGKVPRETSAWEEPSAAGDQLMRRMRTCSSLLSPIIIITGIPVVLVVTDDDDECVILALIISFYLIYKPLLPPTFSKFPPLFLPSCISLLPQPILTSLPPHLPLSLPVHSPLPVLLSPSVPPHLPHQVQAPVNERSTQHSFSPTALHHILTLCLRQIKIP